jgi:hypothetical protein
MAEVFRLVESIPHEELIGCIEPHPARLQVVRVQPFVEERAYLQAGRSAGSEVRDQLP